MAKTKKPNPFAKKPKGKKGAAPMPKGDMKKKGGC